MTGMPTTRGRRASAITMRPRQLLGITSRAAFLTVPIRVYPVGPLAGGPVWRREPRTFGEVSVANGAPAPGIGPSNSRQLSHDSLGAHVSQRVLRAHSQTSHAAVSGQERGGCRLVPDRDAVGLGADRGDVAAATRAALSLSAASLANRSARRRAVFSASACCAVLVSAGGLTVFFVWNCASARRRLSPPGRSWERTDTASSLKVDDLTGRHLLPGISLEPVSRGVLSRQSTRRQASDLPPRFLSDDDSMIPWPVVGHWALDRKRPIISVRDDQIERLFAGHAPISLIEAP
jgi:hypothetical protein